MIQRDAKEAQVNIIIVEKYLNGLKILEQILKMENYEVSIAKSGSQAIKLLKEGRTNIVLMNVYHCMYSSEVEPKLTIRKIEALDPTLLVTCSSSNDQLNDLFLQGNLCSEAAFELPSATHKHSDTNRVLQMCSALRQSRYQSPTDGDFNWQRFSLLMRLPVDAYLGCRFLR